MFLSSMRTGIFSGIFLAILVMGGVGLILSDRGNFFHNGFSKTDVIVIDGQPVKSVEFDRIVRRNLQSQNISASDAYKAGIIDRIVQNEVMTRLLHRAAYQYGMVADDKTVSLQLHKVLEPVVGPGGDIKDALAKVLRAQGMSEQTLVESLRNDISSGLLKQTIGGGIYVPSSMTNAFYQWNLEQRDISYVVLPDSKADIKPPSDATLNEFYQTIKASYSVPEMRDVTVAIVDPSQLVKKKEVTDQQVQDFYNKNKDKFSTPETRTLEQAILKTEDEAKNVLKEAQVSKNLKEAVTKVTGKTESYNKPANFEEKSLPEEISKPAFSAETGTFTGPVKTALGWHVIFVQSVQKESEKPFDQVKAEIKKQLADTTSSDYMYEVTNQIEDRLANGEKPEDMADDFKMKIIPISQLQVGAAPDALKDYANDKVKIVEAAFSTNEGEASALGEISGGKLFTVHVNKVTPAKPKDLKDVKEDIAAKWMAMETRKKVLINAMKMTGDLDSKKTSIDKLAQENGVKVQTGTVVRGSNPPTDIAKQGVAQIMAADTDKTVAIPDTSGIAIIVINKVRLPEKTPTASELSDIEKNLTLDLQEERFVSFINNVEDSAKVTVNHDLIDKLYGQTDTE